MYEIRYLEALKYDFGHRSCAVFDAAIALMRAASVSPGNEVAEREHCAETVHMSWPRAVSDWEKTCLSDLFLRERAAVRAECAAEIERLGKSCDSNRDIRDQQEGILAAQQVEIERLKAQLSGVGMQEFRRLEGRLHNAQAEIERLKVAHRELLQAGCLAAECLAEVRTGSDFEVECHEAGRDLRELLKGLDR
jgi:septal ring factor EnvC (AmiA/AmiB activator)